MDKVESAAQAGQPAATRWGAVLAIVGAGVVASLQVGKVIIAAPLLRRDLGLDLASIGTLTAVFSILGVLGGIAAGGVIARFGARRMLLWGLATVAAGTAAGALAPGYGVLLASRVVEGLGFLLITVAGPAALQRLVLPSSRDLAFALWSCYMPAGMAIAMLASQAEVVGLHPMTAPPKAPTLKGRVMVVCEARLQHWQPWVDTLCTALQAECVRATPQHHDQMMALVQAMVHATHLAQAGVLRQYQAQLGDLAAMMPYRSASFELDTAIISRILSLNPAIYECIQFGNPYVAPMLERLVGQLQALQAQVGQGDDGARAAFRERLLSDNRSAFGEQALADGNYTFERVGYLLADLTERNALSVHLPEDRPGSLRELLNVFEQHRISLASIHSSRTPGGEVHFRIGFIAGSDPAAITRAAAEVDASGIGRVLG